jgi:predicted RNA binding protein YcfA (HicA-like mRNA interferase family)
MVALFERSGWKKLRQSGSHLVMGKGQRREVIPMHNRELKRGLERKLLKTLEDEKP